MENFEAIGTEVESDPICVSCNKPCGHHSCRSCKKPCHAISLCSQSSGEEGYGAQVICNGCSSTKSTEEGTAKIKKMDESAFSKLFKRASGQLPATARLVKRSKHGHENTLMAICLTCFHNGKKKFWLTRFNPSTADSHAKSNAHQGENLKVVKEKIVSENSPAAKEAMKAYRKIKSRDDVDSNQVTKVPSSNEPASSDEAGTENVTESTNMEHDPIDCSNEADTGITSSFPDVTEFQLPTTSFGPAPPTHLHSYQTSLDSFLPQALPKDPVGLPFDLDSLAEKLASKLAQKMSSAAKDKQGTALTNPQGQSFAISATNLLELLDEFPQFELIGEEGNRVLRCSTCVEFLSSPVSYSSSFRQPAGGSCGALSKGLLLSEEVYELLVAGKCQKWYHQKERIGEHLVSKTHCAALEHMKSVDQGNSRKLTVIKNQLRTAIGIVKSKAAAVQYEARIAELQASGADVGDFGHSRKLFPAMLSTVCAYIDKKTTVYLSTPLPSTGMPPHFYVTADKSTNHRITNQVTLVCPVVDGNRKGIVLNAAQVYDNSDATGGTGDALANAIFRDLEKHVGIKDERLLQMQGKVMDGQYLNKPFVAAMNAPIMQQLGENAFGKDRFWWPAQWDPAHWLDKVFAKFKDSPFVDRLLKRTALFHQLFGHGKMHSVARETSKDLSLPFRVTNTYAHQRFMSSSYLSLKNLEESLEVYIETFKDHDNRKEVGYKICGQDFVLDLIGVLDLLWPLVVLMLQSQANWCPGWKLCTYVPLVKVEMEKILDELDEDIPAVAICPRLHKRIQGIRGKRYGNSKLETGWLGVVKGDKISWVAREPHDCLSDLKDLGEKLISELDERFERSYADLNKTLYKCLDFGGLFTALCGTSVDGSTPVDNRKFSEHGAAEFRQCVTFVSQMPHIQNKNMELGSELSATVFWRMKKVLLEVVWGEMFQSHFWNFFKKITTLDGGKDTLEIPKLLQEVTVRKFEVSASKQFTLSDVFSIELSNGEAFQVVFQEENVITALYNDSSFYSLIGPEFCLIFDIMYAKTGTEAVAESFYRVVEKQEMDGGQSHEVLVNRSKIDWSLPPVIQCESALTEMARIYIDGDKARGLKRHHVPVYKDKRSWRKSEDDLSKVVRRIVNTPAKFPFLL